MVTSVVILSIVAATIFFTFCYPLNLGLKWAPASDVWEITFGPYVLRIADPDGAKSIDSFTIWTGWELWKQVGTDDAGIVWLRPIKQVHYSEVTFRELHYKIRS